MLTLNPKFKKHVLQTQILMALASMLVTNQLFAACVDNGNATQACTGTSSNLNTLITGTITLDNASGAIDLTNKSTDGNTITGPGTTDIYGIFYPDIGAIFRNTSATLGEANTMVSNGSNVITINNFGSNITIDGTTRVFDPAAWTNDANGLLYNGGILAGYASAIRANAATSALIINNANVADDIFYPGLQTFGLNAYIKNTGEYTAAVQANSALLTINTGGSGNGSATLGDIVSYAGATYTAPTLQDGTQYATNVVAGKTIINASPLGGLLNLYVVDKSPLLTDAQAANPSLVLALNPTEVGPRDSIINLNQGNIGNLYLGSGAHVINADQGGIGNIFVDQRDSEVISVIGGVATPLYKVHGDRTFTLNSTVLNSGVGVGDITIQDVTGAVNTINLTIPVGSYIFTNFTAQGLGNNQLNVNCFDALADAFFGNSLCSWQLSNVTGFTNFNLDGSGYDLFGTFNVAGDVNLNAKIFNFDSRSSFTASNVIVGSNTSLNAPGGVTGFNKAMGSITGNLINNGTVNVGDATFNIAGDVTMNSGSKFIVDIGPKQTGQLNAAGNTNFMNGSSIAATISPRGGLVHDGDARIVATNATSVPTVSNGDGFVQWSANNASGDLVLTADVAVPKILSSQVSSGAINAVDAFFSYKGNAPVSTELQMALEQFKGKNVIRAAERLRPEIHDGAIRMVLGNTDKLFGVLETRLLDTYLHNNNSENTNLNPNTNEGPATSKGLWVQAIGDRGSQEPLNGADGYSVSSAGMAAGIDRALDAYDGNTRLGFALGYIRGNMTNSGNTVNNRIDTNSYIAAVYASYIQPDWYFNGALGVGRNTYATRRELIDFSATGQHDSWQLSSRVDAGWPILFEENLTLIPMVSFDYSHVNESGYQENGKVSRPTLDYSRTDIPPQPVVINGVPQFSLENSPINLSVQSRSFDSYRSGLGGKLIYSFQDTDWAAELELHGIYRHEFGNLAQNSEAKFVQGGSGFQSAGIKPVRDDFILGTSLRLTSDDENDQLTLLASYDANVREKYFGQLMSLNVRYDFDQAPKYLKKAKIKQANKSEKTQQISSNAETVNELEVLAIQQATQELAEENLTNVEVEHQKNIDMMLKNWALALSNKSLEVYFNSYASNFISSEGLTRQQWQKKRKNEISREDIKGVKISFMSIKPNGESAVAIFTQAITGREQQTEMQKVLDLVLKNGRWLIARENSLIL